MTVRSLTEASEGEEEDREVEVSSSLWVAAYEHYTQSLLTLPEGQKNDALDRQEFENWREGGQLFLERHIELELSNSSVSDAFDRKNRRLTYDRIHRHCYRDGDGERRPKVSEAYAPTCEAIVAEVL